MDELEKDPIAQQYEDGTVAGEIEHMLCMHLHELNTIGEIEVGKRKDRTTRTSRSVSLLDALSLLWYT